MKIGFIVPGFSASEEDWCVPAQLNLVRHLSRRVEVHVFPLRYPHHRCSYTVYGARVHAQGGAETRGLRRIGLLREAVTAVMAEHRRGPFDVLHAIWVDEPGFVAAAAGRLLGVPAVASLFGGELVGLPDIGYGSQLSRMSRWFVRVSLRQAACVTAGSSYLRRLVESDGGARRLESIPIGVDTEIFYPPREETGSSILATGDVRLLHAASLVPIKDQATLLRATSRVVQRIPGVHLHVLGEGPLRGELETLAESLEIRGHVTFHGAARYERMPAYYRAADLCVMSSRHEGQELVTLEAAACGRGTVGTAVGVLPDLAPAAEIVPVGDHIALAEALVGVLEDSGAAATMGEASLEAVRDDYTLERTMTALLGLYAELAGPAGGRIGAC